MKPRLVWYVAAGYVLLRILLAVSVPVIEHHGDTPSYLIGPNLIGQHSRPWTVPLLFSLVDTDWVPVVQAAFSAVAFLVLAAAIASTINDRRVKLAVASVVLLLGLAPRTTVWDTALLSESLAISLTALLIAGLVWIDRVPWWSIVAVFCLWVFTRDAHLYLGALVLIGAGVWGWQHRRAALPVGMLIVLLWGGLASRGDDSIESYNVVSNIAYHAPYGSDNWDWFAGEGMPDSAAFRSVEFFQRQRGLLADDEFRTWAGEDGVAVYTKFMATHPLFVAGGLQYLMVNPPGDGSLVDVPLDVTPVGVWMIWPGEATVFTALLALGGLTAALWLSRRGQGRRILLPTLLAASTFPHALLAYHATPIEVARHGVVLAFVLVVSCWWLVAIAADVLLQPPLGVQVGLDEGDVATAQSVVVDDDLAHHAIMESDVAGRAVH